MKTQITIELKPEQIRDDNLIRKIASRKCKIREDEITGIEYLKRSLDSRHSKPRFILLAEVVSNEPFSAEKPVLTSYKNLDSRAKSVIIVGAGPAGYFAALELIENGIKPIIFERGKDVRSRRLDLKQIMQNGIVDPHSNYCFGEGGAGTYSDGKLYTRSNKRGDVKKVLRILVALGASPDILIDAHPHIGSNKLHKIIIELRNTIINNGGEVHFNSHVTDIIVRDKVAAGVIINNQEEKLADAVLLATGHSARDIFNLLNNKQIYIEPKSFAVGFRIEHYQELINSIQYGKDYNRELPPATYSLAVQVRDRGCFSFCMCPGGIIVPAVTNKEEMVVNGMSMSGRNSNYANSGIVTTVDSQDFSPYSSFGPLAGMKFQENLEKRFFLRNSAHPLTAPAQRLTDFIAGKSSSSLNPTSYIPGLQTAEMHRLFPKELTNCLQSGLKQFGNKMKGFLSYESNIIGLESRTSSPVRVPRNKEDFEHIEIKNLYPCGEGAGYAGGIVSSAIDGQNAANAISKKFGS